MWMTVLEMRYQGHRLRVDADFQRQTVADGSIDAGDDVAVDWAGYIDGVRQPDVERQTGSPAEIVRGLEDLIDQGTFLAPPGRPRL